MTVNPDLTGLFDDWQMGTTLLVVWQGGAAQGRLMSITNGVITLAGPGALMYVDGTTVAVTGPINVTVANVQSVAFVTA